MLAIILLAGVWLAASLSPAPNDPCAQYTGNHQAYKECIEAASTQAVAEYTEWLAGFTAVLAFFTIVLAGASVWQGRLTRQSIDLARDDFTATHRPWLSVDVEIGPRGLFFNENGANITLVLKATNTGNSPAKDVAFIVRPVFFPRPPDGVAGMGEAYQNRVLIEQKRLSDLTRNDRAPGASGRIVFPSESPLVEFTTFTFATREQLEEWTSESDVLPLLVIIGFVSYRFTFGARENHQTGFAFDISRRRAGEAGVFALRYPEHVPGGEAVLFPWWQGAAFYAD
ncbi:MAG TPA: hypothetical protein VHU18_08140 [Rhizomicrobium sp.]|nr:hypothetical protein [Rhizomicrobium sp.]